MIDLGTHLVLALDALIATVSASIVCRITTGSWPAASGLVGLLLLWMVGVALAKFTIAHASMSKVVWGDPFYGAAFQTIVALLMAAAQREFLSPPGKPKIPPHFVILTFIASLVGVYLAEGVRELAEASIK